MAKKPEQQVFLRWTKHVPLTDVQDPLALNLRVSARIGKQLLFCITSATPRARYYSFFPWCVFDYYRRENNQPHDPGLTQAVRNRENALAVGCVVHHEGGPCERGGVIGSTKVVDAYDRLKRGKVDVSRLVLVDAPAYDIYFNSLWLLGLFKTPHASSLDDEYSEEEKITREDLELSDLGLTLAKGYDAMVGRLDAVKETAAGARRCSAHLLGRWGERGGLCELTDPGAVDRPLLRDVFFDRNAAKGGSHGFRRLSLLLILELVRKFQSHEVDISSAAFSRAVYCGGVVLEDETVLPVKVPKTLHDIAQRWRMFYFHYYLSVALEGLFSKVVSLVRSAGLSGIAMSHLSPELLDEAANHDFNDLFDVSTRTHFAELSPRQLLSQFGLDLPHLPSGSDRSFDDIATPQNTLAEWRLDRYLRRSEVLGSPAAVPVALALIAVSLARFSRWYGGTYGHWLANCVEDPNSDIAPPVVAYQLSRHFGDWWNTPWNRLAPFILSRFVVRQHVNLAYEKSQRGTRCLFQLDGERVRGGGSYDEIGVGNPRFGNAVKILFDLAMIESADDQGYATLTTEGKHFLRQELAAEAKR